MLSVRVAGEGVEAALIADPEVYFVTGPVRVHGGGPETSGAVAVASGRGAGAAKRSRHTDRRLGGRSGVTGIKDRFCRGTRGSQR